MTFEQFGQRLTELEARVQEIEDRLPSGSGTTAKQSSSSGADGGDAKKEPKRER